MWSAFVLCSSSLFLSYWTGRPTLCFAILLATQVIWTGIFEFQDGLGHPEFAQFALYNTLSLSFGALIGGTLGWIIEKPQYDLSAKNWVYHLFCIIATLLWIGSLLCWQLIRNFWWKNVFLGIVLQTIIIVLSFFLIGHESAWNSPPESHESFVVHWHFFMVSILCLDVPFVVGSTVSHLWSFYWSIAFFGSSLLYILFINNCHKIRVAKFLPPPTPIITDLALI
jgi:hypothetical protein